MNPTEVLKAREQFVIDKFNEAGMTSDNRFLIDVLYATKDKPDGEAYFAFLLKVMGE
ncbi:MULTISPECIES: hypothetical protein [unclassified Nostoc]|uniref:hypothetical protein n=1 Tax=unclassified Nostoc TaxID=2593658 RepID=UPI0015D47369|nr:hypothetical protein [Nostoc sp. 'Peltigera malacea cyanobiont' DB3992]